ncbi:cytochrome c biogenesis protein CcsA [Luteolibacter pohnpeiensis]|uniref:Cytochrome c biogenesis protein CcsA n=1 Tax=Luteolibacter pohnpeiensis TaxID=454153 RepID=A0A934S8X0_9BACT|nr:cytochrome c biogenesis protein CcsA [Luteolibacter pohnpeiensis]MBK1883409.1 cytochrome c biogenesis protein CcsA [Luteolibacter pohnpeiensis]
MDHWLLIFSTLLAAAGAFWGILSVRQGKRSRWTVIWMAGTFLLQLGFLTVRGQDRAACPLRDTGEILVYLSWSLTLFYLLIGPAYRISLLGVFSAPLVVIFQSTALFPGVLAVSPERVANTSPWGETHSAVSVLSYGAFALAAVAGTMFLVLDHQLKAHQMAGGLFRNLPPIRELLTSLGRLLWLGLGLLTIGIIAGLLMPRNGSMAHLIAAIAVWFAYAILLLVRAKRGLSGRSLSLFTVAVFVLSLAVFALI